MKAVSVALIENPMFNSSISEDGKSIIFKKYVNIGMAVDTPAGLMVPVIEMLIRKDYGKFQKRLLNWQVKRKKKN